MLKAEQEAPSTPGWPQMNCADIVKADVGSTHHSLCQKTIVLPVIQQADLLLWRTAATKSHGVFKDPTQNTIWHTVLYVQRNKYNMWLSSLIRTFRSVTADRGELLKTLLLMWEGRTRITKWGGGKGCLTIQESQERCFSLIKRRSWIVTKELNYYCVLAAPCVRTKSIYCLLKWKIKWFTVLLLWFVISQYKKTKKNISKWKWQEMH